MSTSGTALEAKLQAATSVYTKLESGASHSSSNEASDECDGLIRSFLLLCGHSSARTACADYAKAVEARQRLDAQKTENESVKKVRLTSDFIPVVSRLLRRRADCGIRSWMHRNSPL